MEGLISRMLWICLVSVTIGTEVGTFCPCHKFLTWLDGRVVIFSRSDDWPVSLNYTDKMQHKN